MAWGRNSFVGIATSWTPLRCPRGAWGGRDTLTECFAHRQTGEHAGNTEAHFAILVRRHYLSRYCMGCISPGQRHVLGPIVRSW